MAAMVVVSFIMTINCPERYQCEFAIQSGANKAVVIGDWI